MLANHLIQNADDVGNSYPEPGLPPLAEAGRAAAARILLRAALERTGTIGRSSEYRALAQDPTFTAWVGELLPKLEAFVSDALQFAPVSKAGARMLTPPPPKKHRPAAGAAVLRAIEEAFAGNPHPCEVHAQSLKDLGGERRMAYHPKVGTMARAYNDGTLLRAKDRAATIETWSRLTQTQITQYLYDPVFMLVLFDRRALAAKQVSGTKPLNSSLCLRAALLREIGAPFGLAGQLGSLLFDAFLENVLGQSRAQVIYLIDANGAQSMDAPATTAFYTNNRDVFKERAKMFVAVARKAVAELK